MNNTSLNKSEPSIKNDRLKAARDYLGALENVANYGRTTANPTEVAAALRVFAEPSQALKRQAEESRRVQC